MAPKDDTNPNNEGSYFSIGDQSLYTTTSTVVRMQARHQRGDADGSVVSMPMAPPRRVVGYGTGDANNNNNNNNADVAAESGEESYLSSEWTLDLGGTEIDAEDYDGEETTYMSEWTLDLDPELLGVDTTGSQQQRDDDESYGVGVGEDYSTTGLMMMNANSNRDNCVPQNATFHNQGVYFYPPEDSDDNNNNDDQEDQLLPVANPSQKQSRAVRMKKRRVLAQRVLAVGGAVTGLVVMGPFGIAVVGGGGYLVTKTVGKVCERQVRKREERQKREQRQHHHPEGQHA